jgi:hypothetical protein
MRKHTTLCRLIALTAAIGAVVISNVPVLAQGPPAGPGGFGGRGGGRGGFGGGRGGFGQRQITAATLPVETLDAIVKLTPTQKTKITQLHDGFTKSMMAMRPQPGAPPDPAMRQKFGAAITQANQAIDAVLTAPQKTKLAAAAKDLALYRLAGIPFPLYGQIQLTAAQKTGLAQIQQSVSGPQADRNARRAARDKAVALLTPAQKALVDKYEQEHPNQRGGFGGGGGRGGRGPGGPGGFGGRGGQ